MVGAARGGLKPKVTWAKGKKAVAIFAHLFTLTSTSALVGVHTSTGSSRMSEPTEKTSLLAAWPPRRVRLEELRQAWAAAKLRRFLRNKRSSSSKILVSGPFIDPSGDNKASDKGIDKGEGD